MTPFEQQVAEVLKAVLPASTPYTMWAPALADRLAPRVAAAIEAASTESARAERAWQTNGRDPEDHWQDAALTALRGDGEA